MSPARRILLLASLLWLGGCSNPDLLWLSGYSKAPTDHTPPGMPLADETLQDEPSNNFEGAFQPVGSYTPEVYRIPDPGGPDPLGVYPVPNYAHGAEPP